jgi:hypothetical protein
MFVRVLRMKMCLNIRKEEIRCNLRLTIVLLLNRCLAEEAEAQRRFINSEQAFTKHLTSLAPLLLNVVGVSSPSAL